MKISKMVVILVHDKIMILIVTYYILKVDLGISMKLPVRVSPRPSLATWCFLLLMGLAIVKLVTTSFLTKVQGIMWSKMTRARCILDSCLIMIHLEVF